MCFNIPNPAGKIENAIFGDNSPSKLLGIKHKDEFLSPLKMFENPADFFSPPATTPISRMFSRNVFGSDGTGKEKVIT